MFEGWIYGRLVGTLLAIAGGASIYEALWGRKGYRDTGIQTMFWPIAGAAGPALEALNEAGKSFTMVLADLEEMKTPSEGNVKRLSDAVKNIPDTALRGLVPFWKTGLQVTESIYGAQHISPIRDVFMRRIQKLPPAWRKIEPSFYQRFAHAVFGRWDTKEKRDVLKYGLKWFEANEAGDKKEAAKWQERFLKAARMIPEPLTSEDNIRRMIDIEQGRPIKDYAYDAMDEEEARKRSEASRKEGERRRYEVIKGP